MYFVLNNQQSTHASKFCSGKWNFDAKMLFSKVRSLGFNSAPLFRQFLHGTVGGLSGTLQQVQARSPQLPGPAQVSLLGTWFV
jgi:hypothetical protein